MDTKMKEAITSLIKNRRFQNWCLIILASVVAYITGKRILKYYGVRPSKKDKRDFGISMAENPARFQNSFCLPLPVLKNQQTVSSCHDDQTEVMTRYGWKFFKEISSSDLLASVNPEDGNLIFENPINILRQRYIGKMIYGTHRSIDFMVTPNHKMIVKKWEESKRVLSEKYSVVDASDLGFCVGLRTDFYQNKKKQEVIILPEEKVSNGNILPRMEIKLSDWVKFLGIYLAEGTMLDPSRHYPIQIAAFKNRERSFVENLFNRMGIHGVSSKDRYVVSNKRIWSLLSGYGLYKVKSYDKFVPDFIFDLDSELIKDFLYGFAMGDGYFTKEGEVRYYTSSKLLAEQLRMLMVMSGSSTTMYTRDVRGKKCFLKDGRTIISKHIGYVINQWKTNSLGLNRKKNIKEVDYDGYVYCAEVPTYHTLITRRNGKVLLSGNCCAHSMSYIAESILPKSGDYNLDRVSVGWIYGYRPAGYYQGEGMYPRQALNTIQKKGVIRHRDFPYNEEVPAVINRVNGSLDDLLKKAEPNKIPVFFQLKTDDEIKQCLTKYGPVSIMYPVYDSFNTPVEGKIETARGKFYGYHQVTLYGWTGDCWLMVNNWGNWDEDGIAYIHKSYPWQEAWGLSVDPSAAIEPQKKTSFLKSLFG